MLIFMDMQKQRRKNEVLGIDYSTTYSKAADADEAGIDPAVYYMYRLTVDSDDNGTVTQDETKSALQKMRGLTLDQRAYLYKLQNKDWKNNPYT